MRLSEGQHRILVAMREGATLKAHRALDGAKIHVLYPLEGPPIEVDGKDVAALKGCGLIASNMKFPAAVYLLTAAATNLLS